MSKDATPLKWAKHMICLSQRKVSLSWARSDSLEEYLCWFRSDLFKEYCVKTRVTCWKNTYVEPEVTCWKITCTVSTMSDYDSKEYLRFLAMSNYISEYFANVICAIRHTV